MIVDSKDADCKLPENREAFCAIAEIEPVDPGEFKAAYNLESLLYEHSVVGLLAAYRSVAVRGLAEMKIEA